MMIVAFEPEHLKKLQLQPAQEVFASEFVKPDYAQQLASGLAFTALDGDKVVGCAGFYPQWEHRDLAWALMAHDAGSYMLRIVRAIARAIDIRPTRRIEAFVPVNFPQGDRMLAMLGFEREGYARAFTPDGVDCNAYALVRGV